MSVGSRNIHLRADVLGMLRNRAFDGLQDEDGLPLTRRDAERLLRKLAADGVKYLPVGGDCPDFDPQHGCPGHPHPTAPEEDESR